VTTKGFEANLDWQGLVESATEASQRAYIPYSKFAVGAALLGASGRVYTGCNVENVSFSMTVCAERTAVFKAVSEGEQEFVALVVFSSNGATPCGACRQVLREFCQDLPILAVGAGGESRLYLLSELFPAAFAPDDLPDPQGSEEGDS